MQTCDLKLIIFQLEDLAVIPNVQDPRLNTVECVVEGHNNFDGKIFSSFRKLLMCACWCILLVSAVVGFAVSNIVITWLDDKHKKQGKTRPEKKDKKKKFPLKPITASNPLLLSTDHSENLNEPERSVAASRTSLLCDEEPVTVLQESKNRRSDNTNPSQPMETSLASRRKSCR